MVRFGRILNVIEEDNLVENAATVGSYLLEKLQELHQQYEELDNPRGKGLLCAIDLPDTTTRDAVIKTCFRNKMLILPCGEKTIRFRPPLTVQNQHIDEAVGIIRKSLESVVGSAAMA